jgi:hypothetical protein
MTNQFGPLNFVDSLRCSAFPEETPAQLGLRSERLIPEIRGPRGELWSLGGLGYSLFIDGLPGEVAFQIQHHNGDDFLLSLCPPGYTYMMRPVQKKDLSAEVLFAMNHAKRLAVRK